MVKLNDCGLPSMPLRVIHEPSTDEELSLEDEFELDGARSGAKVIIIGNGKGGVGKTTLAAGLTAFYARMGLRAIAFDFDPQSNLSLRMGLPEGEFLDNRIDTFLNSINKPNIDSLFMKLPLIVKLKHFVRAKRSDREPGVMSIIGGSDLANIAADAALRSRGVNNLSRKDKRDLYEVFRDCVEQLKPYYDVIIIDLSPAFEGNTLSRMAIRVADEVIVPVDGLEAAVGLSNYVSWINNETSAKFGVSKKPNITFAMVKYQKDYSPKGEKVTDDQNPLEKNVVYRILKHHLGTFVCDNGIQESKTIRNILYTGIGQNSIYDELCNELMEKMSTQRPDIFEYWGEISMNLQKMLARVETQYSRPETTIISPVFINKPVNKEVFADAGSTPRPE